MIIPIMLLTVGLVMLITLLALIRAYISDRVFFFLWLVVFIVGVTGGVLYIV